MNKELKKRIVSSIFILPISIFFIIQEIYYFAIFFSILFIITSYEWYKMTNNYLLRLCGIIFLLLSFLSTFNLRIVSLELFFFIIIICISTDIGGYIFGKIFKGPKLTKISPNKTYSGAIGGLILSVLISYIFINFYTLKNFYLFPERIFLISILFISVVSQLGDLIISFFKRISKIKNTGNIIPGHGGLLDRLDGMIFVFPVIYLIIIILK